MERQESKQASVLMWVLAAGLLSHNLAFPVLATTFGDQKNYYSPDPHSRSPPSGGSSVNPPSHSTPSTPSGGPTPSIPSGGNCGTPPSVATPPTPSNPPRGGGYHPTPPTTGGSPPTPVIVSPPTTPRITPGTPFTPTPPFIPDPNSPFSCNYWRTHPALIWGVMGWWGTMGNAFGVTSLPGFGTSMTLQQALSNTRTDGYGTLYREGTASLLNSMVSNRFSFTTRQVRENFVASLASNKAAGAQGHLFKLANEGRLKPRV
ncbi:PREDICTED: protodermal factor 1-like [Populus euphratica]|uniref:Protodermal factor 1-like n=1 Tax=Populus euphratica TaxID=75702 RepID=A0AAJ6UB89_POPEU|nr:PREDICTED: protodermal factor 1-like [Populus euphratica]